MKKSFLIIILILVVTMALLGCNTQQHNQLNEKQVQQKSETDTEGFIEPEPSEWVKYIKPVREYLHYRTQSVVNGDITMLWKRYPQLEGNVDRNKGINSEQYEDGNILSGSFIDANFSEESHGRIKVKTMNEHEVIILVHGGIVYLKDDFDESGGEFLIKLFLEKKDNQWNVVKTDEYTLPEYKEWIKNNGSMP
ncbi:putative lipoprotein NlpE involved in copper resistance [Paenibacillus sp. DS2015]|uniref:hypothetical protein n=1 Tax=Paenibacillus sp. DS2015 TaxID=3373917 RepID=UPI003D198BE6